MNIRHGKFSTVATVAMSRKDKKIAWHDIDEFNDMVIKFETKC